MQYNYFCTLLKPNIISSIMVRKGLFWCICFLWFQVQVFAQEMVFSAQANAQKVGTKDQFQITYTLSNAPGASNFQAPSFSGFSIVGGPYQSNNSSLSIVNGQTRQTSSVTLTYVLIPTKAGTLTIPPAKVEVNGRTMSSNPVTVQVINGSVAGSRNMPRNEPEDDPFAAIRQYQQQMRQQMQQLQRSRQQQAQQHTADMESLSEDNLARNIFIKVEVDKTNPYLGEQITASYKLYTRLPMSVNLTQLPSLNGFWSQDFQIPNPPKAREEIVDGKRYQVFLLKKSALFPQQAGVLELDAAKAEGIVRVLQQVKGRHPFADDPFASFFMDDPFFNDDAFSGYNYKDVKTKLSSQPVKITVKPLPVQGQPQSFTGGVGSFQVKAAIDKTNLSTDEAATLSFTVSGSGNLKLIGSPQVNFPAELGIYEPAVTDTITGRNPAITGQKIFTYTISPQSPGEYTIPSIPFSYYDVESGQYKTLQSDPIKIQVTKGKNYSDAISANQTLPGDIHDIIASPLSQSNNRFWVNSFSYWIWYLLGAAALTGLLIWNRRKEHYAENQVLFRNKKANKVAWKRLSAARKLLAQQQHKAFYEEVSKAVWLYLSDKLNIPLSSLNKENISIELSALLVPASQINRVQQLILECEMALYSPAGGQQQRQQTLDEAAAIITALESVLKNKNNVLQHVAEI